MQQHYIGNGFEAPWKLSYCKAEPDSMLKSDDALVVELWLLVVCLAPLGGK